MKINDFGEFCKGTPLQFWQVGHVLERLRSVFAIFPGFFTFRIEFGAFKECLCKIRLHFCVIFHDFHGFSRILDNCVEFEHDFCLV